MNIPDFVAAMRNAHAELLSVVQSAHESYLMRVHEITAEFHGSQLDNEPAESQAFESIRRARDI